MTKDTCSKEEYLEIYPDILNLVKEVLIPEDIELGNQISEGLVSSNKKKEWARLRIRKIVGNTPKRPLYYANIDLKYLPRFTRNPARYLGDYVDHLIKFWSSEIVGKTCLKKSLGTNLNLLIGKIDETLRNQLIKYNDLCYVPAKHDFNPKGRVHRITAKECVFIALLSMKFAETIKSYSVLARDYSEEKIDDNWAEMRYTEDDQKQTLFR